VGACLAIGLIVAAVLFYLIGLVGGIAGGILVLGLVFCISGDICPRPPDLLKAALEEYEDSHKSALKARCAEIQAARMGGERVESHADPRQTGVEDFQAVK
jgi:starvation-inducible outer membrane lipoprotein